jgi:hypothetical protein
MSLAGTTQTGGGPFGAPSEQFDWEIDPLGGSDSASGRPGYPLSDFAGLSRRLASELIVEDTTVTVLGTTDENVVLLPRFGAAVGLKVRSVPVAMFSGTLSSGTLEWSDSGHQEVNAACSTIPVSATASDLVGKPWRIVGGDRAGNVTFGAVDLGGGTKTVRCAGWMAPGYYNDTAIVGDAFEVLDIVRCTGAWFIQGLGPGYVWIEDLEIGNRDNLHDVQICSQATISRARLNGTDVQASGSAYIIGSCCANGLRYYGNITLELTAALRPGASSPLDGRTAGNVYLYEQNLVQGGGWLFQQGSTSAIDSTGSVASCDATFAFSFLPQATLDAAGYWWSRNASGRVVNVVGPGATIGYATGREPVNVGTGSPTLLVLCGTSYTSLSTGRVDATKLCAVAPRA